MKAFTAALESLNKPQFSIGQDPTDAWVGDQFFNDSTGEGEDGEIDARGPWNQGADWQFIEAPAFQDAGETSSQVAADRPRGRSINEHGKRTGDDQELLVEELRDLLSAEGQLVKALPRITKAAKLTA